MTSTYDDYTTRGEDTPLFEQTRRERNMSDGYGRGDFLLPYTFNGSCYAVHDQATRSGFWQKGDGRNFGEMMMLITSEAAEALEEHRKDRIDLWYNHGWDPEVPCDLGATNKAEVEGCTCIPKPEGAVVEVVDIIIRAQDNLAALVNMLNRANGTHLTPHDYMEIKAAFNSRRAYMHGKAY